MYEDAAKQLRRRREAAGLTQPALARLINDVRTDLRWHQTTIAKIESGERAIKLDDLIAYSEVLGLSIDQLVLDPHRLEADKTGDDLHDYLNQPTQVVRQILDESLSSKRRLLRFDLEHRRAQVLELERQLEELDEEARRG